MSYWAQKLEKWFSAVAFAEAGEHNTALEMVGLTPTETREPVGVRQFLTTTFAAAAFAEANCHEIAKEILNSDPKKETFAEAIGLKGIRIWYGHVPAAQESFFETLGLQSIPVRFGVVSM
jgi:hypothetical protein